MATLILPTAIAPAAYFYRIELEGEVYELRYLHNDREDAWYLDLYDSEAQPIREGIKLVANTPLLFRIADDRRPPGDALALDTTDQDLDPGLADLGERIVMAYVESAT